MVASDGLRRRRHGEDPPEEYLEKVNYELLVIRETGFAPYFLIVGTLLGPAGRRG